MAVVVDVSLPINKESHCQGRKKGIPIKMHFQEFFFAEKSMCQGYMSLDTAMQLSIIIKEVEVQVDLGICER